ncbi:MAG: hypothetical protein GXP47_02235 [Acidobacteria bacterium]|nr:hypothetical protein [Acidobacteriota bacterium]
MSAVRKNVLLVGVDREVVERLVPLLKRRDIDVLSTAPSPAVLNLLRDTPFDLLVVHYPLGRPGLEAFLEEVRSPESFCRNAGVILVAEDSQMEEALRFEGAGVNRVMTAQWTGGHLWQALADLLQVAPRVAVRTLAHLDIQLGRGRAEDLARSVNLSATGILLEAPARVRPGTPLRLTFRLPEELRPVRGAGEVVRVTQAEREGVDGFAVRFLNLEADGAERVGEWVAARR